MHTVVQHLSTRTCEKANSHLCISFLGLCNRDRPWCIFADGCGCWKRGCSLIAKAPFLRTLELTSGAWVGSRVWLKLLVAEHLTFVKQGDPLNNGLAMYLFVSRALAMLGCATKLVANVGTDGVVKNETVLSYSDKSEFC